MKRIIIVAVVAVVAVAAWLYSRTRPIPVDLAFVTRGPIRAFVEEEGKTRIRHRYVVAAPIAGRLLRIEWKEGDRLEKGTIAARIDPLHLQAAVKEAEAQLESLRKKLAGVDRRKPKPEELQRAAVEAEHAREAKGVAEFELLEAKAARAKAEKDFVRSRAELEARTGSPADFDAAEAAELQAKARENAAEVRVKLSALEIRAAELAEAIVKAQTRDYDWEEAAYRADIDALQAKLVSLKDDLFRADILVPINGQVLQIFQESERYVAAGTPLMEMGDVRVLEVEADLLSEDVAHMREGMAAELFGRALGDDVVKGEIARIYPTAFTKISSLGVEQQRVNVIFTFRMRDRNLGDRYRVEVRVILDEKQDVVLAPEGALFRHEGDWHVFKVEDGRARITPVRTGVRNGLHREILDGLAKGDQVILHPDASLADGKRVEPLGD
jgi:HlyD family secretion protein